MSAAELGGEVLASVSRSFYLTIRILPARLREPIGIAYLLARASDTIADSADAPAAVRLRHLAAFEKMTSAGERTGLTELQREITSPHAGERELIASLGRCLDWLARVDPADRAEIVDVLGKIIRGQALDLERFAESGRVIALQSASELDEYTYLVAGCVGEFWTRICLRHLPRYAALDAGELCRIGVNYGKGLQLVNILRDLPADLRAGRCYLPANELSAEPASLLDDPSTARPVFNRWLDRATAYLDDGRRYVAALRPARVRAGCFIPWYLGVNTIALMRTHPPLETVQKVKVPRSTVRAALFRAALAAWSNAPLRTAG